MGWRITHSIMRQSARGHLVSQPVARPEPRCWWGGECDSGDYTILVALITQTNTVIWETLVICGNSLKDYYFFSFFFYSLISALSTDTYVLLPEQAFELISCYCTKFCCTAQIFPLYNIDRTVVNGNLFYFLKFLICPNVVVAIILKIRLHPSQWLQNTQVLGIKRSGNFDKISGLEN